MTDHVGEPHHRQFLGWKQRLAAGRHLARPGDAEKLCGRKMLLERVNETGTEQIARGLARHQRYAKGHEFSARCRGWTFPGSGSSAPPPVSFARVRASARVHPSR